MFTYGLLIKCSNLKGYETGRVSREHEEKSKCKNLDFRGSLSLLGCLISVKFNKPFYAENRCNIIISTVPCVLSFRRCLAAYDTELVNIRPGISLEWNTVGFISQYWTQISLGDLFLWFEDLPRHAVVRQSDEWAANLRTQHGAQFLLKNSAWKTLQRDKARTGSLGEIQTNCPSDQGSS